MNDIKTYLTDASNNLKQIIPEAVFLRFDENGNVLLEGKFSVMDLQAIVERQIEIMEKLYEMRKENAQEEKAA